MKLSLNKNDLNFNKTQVIKNEQNDKTFFKQPSRIFKNVVNCFGFIEFSKTFLICFGFIEFENYFCENTFFPTDEWQF